MNQKRFLEILNNYRLGKASAEEKKLIDAWYEAMGKKTDGLQDIHHHGLESVYWNSIAAALEKSRDIRSRRLTPRRANARMIKYTLGIAASLVIVFMSFFYVKHSSNLQVADVPYADTLSRWEQLANTEARDQTFVLPDGSSIVLEPKSWIRMAPDFNAKSRVVYLQGAAFFEVAHNEMKPFVVNTGSVMTKVLGTSFTIRAFDGDGDVTVSVRTGRVSVFNNHPATGEKTAVILTPNQEIVYDKQGHTLSRGIVDNPKPLLANEEIMRMKFENAPVAEIFDAIEKIYGIEIVVDEGKSMPCTLTTTVSDGNLFKRLDIVTKAIGAAYTVEGDKIVVSKGACE